MKLSTAAAIMAFSKPLHKEYNESMYIYIMYIICIYYVCVYRNYRFNILVCYIHLQKYMYTRYASIHVVRTLEHGVDDGGIVGGQRGHDQPEVEAQIQNLHIQASGWVRKLEAGA